MTHDSSRELLNQKAHIGTTARDYVGTPTSRFGVVGLGCTYIEFRGYPNKGEPKCKADAQ